jgi:hypothetical protein
MLHQFGRRLGPQLILAIVAVLVAVPAAQASTASRSGDTITITGGPESSNISFPSAGYATDRHIADTAGIDAAAGCEQVSPTEVNCPSPSGGIDFVVHADLGAGDDQYTLIGSYGQSVDGGAGNDRIRTGALDDVVRGGDGDDTLDADIGNDQVDGGAGDDDVKGGGNNDQVDGGPGQDVVQGDGGDITDDGSDRIFTRDGEADQVSCGFGSDVVTADTKDAIESQQCESVDAQPVESGGGGGGGSAPSLAIVAHKSAKLASVTKKPGYGVGIIAGSDGILSVKLVIAKGDAKRAGLGHGTFVIASLRHQVTADSYAVGLWAQGSKAKKLKALRKRHGFRQVTAKLTVTLTDDQGATRTQKATVKLKR